MANFEAFRWVIWSSKKGNIIYYCIFKENYIYFFKISDPNQKTVIICDEKLKAVTKKKKVMCKEIMTYLQKHMIAIK